MIKEAVVTPEIIQDALTYEQYRALIDELLAQGKTTGTNHSEAMLDYTKMNVRRMNRWDRTAVVGSELQEKMKNITVPQVWLVLTEAWCGDAAQSLPFLAKLAAYSDKVDFRLILRDEHPAIMDAYLTQGAKSIPKLVALQQDNLKELFTWGPRPQVLQQKFSAYRDNPEGVSQLEFIESMHLWYARDKHATMDAEFLTLIA